MRIALAACGIAAAACATVNRSPFPLDHAASLAAAERAFAAQSVREDSRAAFLANFADDGVLVRGEWVAALAALRAQPAPPLVLDWHPAYVEAARSGDLGLSTGPWKITPHDLSKGPAYGQFVSVWRRTERGWKVVADIGIPHREPALADAPLELRVAAADAPSDREGFEAAEQAFARDSAAAGPRRALERHASPSVRFYREGHAPLLGLAQALASPALEAAPVDYTLQAFEVARSGELAYARGIHAARDGAGRGTWMRVWRREADRWRVALDVANAAP